MTSSTARICLSAITVFVTAAVPATAQNGDSARRPLDHDVYDQWNRIGSPALSDDGRWAVYDVSSTANDPVLRVSSLDGEATHVIERAEGARVSADSRFVAFTIKPSKAAMKDARRRKVPAAQLPPDTLGILDLATGTITRAARVRDFTMPSEAGGWLAYHLSPDPAAAGEDSASARGRAADDDDDDDSERPEGTPLVIRHLSSGDERRIEDVVAWRFSDDGERLAYTRSSKAGDVDGVHVLDTGTGGVTTLLAGKGEYTQLAMDEAGGQVAFLSNVDEFAERQPSWKLYHWSGGAGSAVAVATPASAGMPSGFWISDNGSLRFSQDGERLFFGTAERPEPEPEDEPDPTEEEVVVDIWNWKDPLLQPMQLSQLSRERRRTYEAVVHLRDGRMVQLARPDIPEVDVALRGDGDIAIGTSDLPYRQEVSWGESGDDIYLIDVRTGEATLLLEYNRGRVSLSPGGRYVTWFDGEELAWFGMDVEDQVVRNLSAAIPFAVHDELHDAPSLPGSYGTAGWTADDERFLIYDRHDIWAVDPTGRAAPRAITEGVGRQENLRFRYVQLDPEERAIDSGDEILLSAFNLWTKDAGYYRDYVNGQAPPARLVMDSKSFGTPRKARDADVLMLTRSDFREFPDLWITDPAFDGMRRISDANPQQADYVWGNAELVDWRSVNGELLQGVLYKPDTFDPTQKYPMIVYFYERLSDNLHDYIAPAAVRASINISYYVSRGYLVFTPDIPYRIGYPGESAMNAVVPGVLSLVDDGFIDEERIGLQGHSWGGYQIAYMITKTNMFRAAEAGAPVANMTSAYGGIRWGTGMSRMFQYEKTQSRLGGTLWEKPLRYIENSPLFWADKVNTPLLMMHNDEDGSVPWEQGIEYFVALRRLGKPVWMLNYNGEDHGLAQEHNRKDWTIRMQQFFDHYLLDAPPPVWMEYGVPAIDKGETLGLDLVTVPISN